MTLGVDVSARFTARGAEPFSVRADLTVSAGETLAVLGPSGSGKSLLLETIAGFNPHEGTVSLGGRDLTDLPPEERDLGFVFQDYALFPHLTVRENVDFGARYHPETRDPDDLLGELGVADLADRYPPTLSGGERQRVALARALAVRPAAFLLDEPLSALDVPTRQALRDDLADLLADETAVYVTHNRTTARALADRVAVIRDGLIVQTGTADEVFERPATSFVARFTGSNCLPADRDGDDLVLPDGTRVALSAPGATHLAIRPEHVLLGEGGATGTVTRATRTEATHRVTVALGDAEVVAYAESPPAVGSEVRLSLPRRHLRPLTR